MPHGRHFVLAHRQDRTILKNQGVGLQAADELCVYDEAFMDPFEGKSTEPRLQVLECIPAGVAFLRCMDEKGGPVGFKKGDIRKPNLIHTLVR